MRQKMAQKTLKINIFPVFSLLIREFWIKNISILLQILHTPWQFKTPLPAGFLYWHAGAAQTALCRVGIRKAQRCFGLRLPRRKAKTASPACRKMPSGILPEGESLPLRGNLKPRFRRGFILRSINAGQILCRTFLFFPRNRRRHICRKRGFSARIFIYTKAVHYANHQKALTHPEPLFQHKDIRVHLY